jgi:hypothetical protein
MTVQQFKVRFNRHPHLAPSPPPPPGVTLPSPPQRMSGQSLPGTGGPIPVPPGGLDIDPSLFDMPELRV